MFKNQTKLLLLFVISFWQINWSQPTHIPSVMYTNDMCERPGHASERNDTGQGGNMLWTRGGIEVHNDTHYLVQKVPNPGGSTFIVNKKNGNNGTSYLVKKYSIKGLSGDASISYELVNDTYLDLSNNRLYICGHTNKGAFVLALHTSNLTPVTSFGTSGILNLDLGSNFSAASIEGTAIAGQFVVVVNSGEVIGFREVNASGMVVGVSNLSMMSHFKINSVLTLRIF